MNWPHNIVNLKYLCRVLSSNLGIYPLISVNMDRIIYVNQRVILMTISEELKGHIVVGSCY